MNKYVKNIVTCLLLLWVISAVFGAVLESAGISLPGILGVKEHQRVERTSVLPMITASFSFLVLWLITVAIFPHFAENKGVYATRIFDLVNSVIKPKEP